MPQPRILFFGTSSFAAVSLRALVEAKYNVVGVITQPDEPVGRKKIITPPPVKLDAQKLNLPFFQPTKLSAFETSLPQYDLAIICAYGKLIPQNILDKAKLGNINIHPSLLPQYRGPSPIQTALLNGDEVSGITLILLDKEMDHGPILAQDKFLIKDKETYPELSDRMANLAADLLIKTIPNYLNNQIKAKEQDHDSATFTKLLTREDGLINWSDSSKKIYNQWRGLLPWPGIWSIFKINKQETKIKFIEILLSEGTSSNTLGTFVKIKENRLGIICGDKKIIEVIRLQPEGKKVLSAKEFINGFSGLVPN